MNHTVISVENLSKVYKLGQIGTGTFANDLTVWWAHARGKPNPLLKIGQRDDGNRRGDPEGGGAGEIWALKDVSFKVEQGEVLGIIGRNGAGKSTLLKILSRVTAPTSGKVKVKGRVASLLEVGTGFHLELTGRENVYLNGAILGMTKQEVSRKFDEIVSFAEVEQFIDTPVKRYSSGMYVRLAFAVAAHLEPEILLVDEVLAVGDAEFQKKCLGKMGEVAEEGRTVLFVSHNMGSIETLCKRGLLLDKGRIVMDDSQSSVIRHYFDLFEHSARGNAASRIDRRGNGKIRLIDIKIRDPMGNHKTNLLMNEKYTVELWYQSTTVINSSNLEFTLVCSNNNEQKVFMQKFGIRRNDQQIPNNGCIEFTPEKNYLAPGTYYFRVVIMNQMEIYDHLDHALEFVITSDIPKNGIRLLPSNQSGICLMDGKWEIVTH
jgi:lipopolysaccharide transport system ATP-binding protein